MEHRISGTVSSKPQRGIGLNRMLREAKLITFQKEKSSVVCAPRDGFVGGPCLTYQCSGKYHIGFIVMM